MSLPSSCPIPEPGQSASGSQTEGSEATDCIEEDPVESWYTSVGYLPRLDESTFDILEQVLSPLAMSEIKEKLYKSDKDQYYGLMERNVQMWPCESTDPFLTVFHDMKPLRESGSGVHLQDLHDEVKKHLLNEWRLDLEKAIEDMKNGLDATFQRTVMMSMLDRYRLMYSLKDGNQPILDYAVESTWNCPPMPTGALMTAKLNPQRILSRPKPDLSIAFRLRSIMGDEHLYAIPRATREIMMYEAQDSLGRRRAFHFLMIETGKTIRDTDSLNQNFNSASQSLHCLYEFFNEADRQEVECDRPCCSPSATTIPTGGREAPPAGEDTFVGLFFKEVRVFTAVIAGADISIRVHRACPASSNPALPPSKGQPPSLFPILPEYPLQFEFDELELPKGRFSRNSLVDTFEKIMVDYGIGRLRPLLQRAAVAIATKFRKRLTETGMDYELGMRHYSHGQTAPSPSARTPRAASEVARWLLVSSFDSPPADPSLTDQTTESPQEQRSNKRRNSPNRFQVRALGALKAFDRIGTPDGHAACLIQRLWRAPIYPRGQTLESAEKASAIGAPTTRLHEVDDRFRRGQLVAQTRLDEVGTFALPSCMALDGQLLRQKSLDIALGFSDGSFGTWRLHIEQRQMVQRYRHEGSSNGEIIGIAFLSPYLLTATKSVLVSLYTFDSPSPPSHHANHRDGSEADNETKKDSESEVVRESDIESFAKRGILRDKVVSPHELPNIKEENSNMGLSAPYLLTSLRSHTSRAPLALSLRNTAGSTVASIAYTFSTIWGWSLGIQELHIRPTRSRIKSPPEITTTQLAYTLPVNRTSQHMPSPPLSPARELRSVGPSTEDRSQGGPISLSYTHPYLLATLPDNTLILHLCTSSASSLSISPGIRLWGHTSGISDAEITARGKAVSVSCRGEEIRVWELEGRTNGRSIEIRPTPKTTDKGVASERAIQEHLNDQWDDRRNWVGFDDEMVIVLKESNEGRESLLVYDFT
ncbi:hypothetical protein O1611_g6544 [Lasiodiplodia mahajangana]|uniref:Uncharacterized protein n=1 Tax=Lasiodiplodia mahajangana TaxID=1108764 RepID=A0ACC2JIP2_9PEZI|nr:hypothetical protein O1611_g6544 [Lasiodiplodia mahajangana]